MAKIRKAAQRIELYNEGLVVFLYDQVHREALSQTQLALFEGFRGADELNDPALAALAAKGWLVAYQKIQDGPLWLELAVGQPMTVKEAKRAHWLQPQQALLNLPSGVLCVETYDSLSLGPEVASESGDHVKIGAGDYVLSLYRLDPLAMEESGVDNVADEFIILTPADQAIRPDAIPAMLIAPEIASSPLPPYEIDGDVFYGQIRFCSDGPVYLVNFSRGAARTLNLTAGMGLRLTVDHLDLALEAVYLGEEVRALSAVRRSWQAWQRMVTEFAEATWASGSDFDQELLLFDRVKGEATIASSDQDRWLTVTVTLFNLA